MNPARIPATLAPVGDRMPDEVTEEILEGLPEAVRLKVQEALLRKRAEDALGPDAAGYLRLLSGQVVGVRDDLASLLAFLATNGDDTPDDDTIN